MPLPENNSGEYASSTEYMKEYGGLIIDISTLVDTLDARLPAKNEVRNFTIERVEEPLQIPQVAFEAIGEVTTAEISYDTHMQGSTITVELFGQESSYRISRSADSQEAIDSVIDIAPTDPFTAALLGHHDEHSLPHHSESSEAFEERIHNIPGIDNADFVRLLLNLAQPNIAIDTSEETNAQLAATNPFDPHVYQSFIDSSSVTSQLQSAFFEYEFTADDSAELVFSQENGHPSYFQFACRDAAGETLQIRGTMSKSIELDFPQHAIAYGLNGDFIDTTHSFSLTLSEIKYIRNLLKEEIDSMPQEETIEVDLVSQADFLPAPDALDLATVDARIEHENEERALEARARKDALDDELAHLLAEQQEDDE